MKYCISCGKKIQENLKFCVHCGTKLTVKDKPEISFKSNNLLIILVVFILIVGFVIIIKSRSSGISAQKSPILQRELSDNLINIITPEDSRKYEQQQVKREGFDIYAKSFAEGNYAYDERTKDFRFVCSSPCPLSKAILDQEFGAINYAVSTLRGLTKSDLDEDILPFEVHASTDNICTYNPRALAYMTTFTDSNGYNRGLLCFFFERLEYDRSKFPYSTSVHEVTHLFEYGKLEHNSILWEGLSEMMESFFLKGNERNSFCWEGNDWYGAVVNNPHDTHGTGRQLFFSLCKQYGFDYQKLPELFRQLDARNGDVDGREFVRIINGIVGADTSHIFRDAGVI